MQQPTVLLFDLGGVLVENVGFERLNALLPTPLPLEELKARWLASTAVRSFEVGDLFAQTHLLRRSLRNGSSRSVRTPSSKRSLPGQRACIQALPN